MNDSTFCKPYSMQILAVSEIELALINVCISDILFAIVLGDTTFRRAESSASFPCLDILATS